MTELSAIKPSQMDALREVTNIGTGHATTVLSQMTNMNIMITASKATVMHVEDVAKMWEGVHQSVVVVGMRMLGDLTGHMVLMLPKTDADELARVLLSHDGPGAASSELGESSLKEAANVMAASFMNALSSLANLLLMPSVPELVKQPPDEISAVLHFNPEAEQVLCMETNFHVDMDSGESNERDLKGAFLFLPDGPSLDALFSAINVQ